ncbi:dienelactone hydrolase-like enzyme [Corynebacterium epidermidicanis]|uniref:Dienelactone hydrolase-like enzyme n=2 Tax=Corynebacterium epidermidicanis TaxID=1050174 RepID=A0A0G3GU14_9CORY|nr:dienelactone hydrolase-like enzyme [Corynebacterium epidermidicanis]
MSNLSKRGPHRVLVGDLEYAGLPGRLYTPAEGNGLPAVAFGHDWMTDIKRYHATLRHLASWGIVVAAPATEVGPLPNHKGLASDLETALQILTGVKLGAGHVTVAPGKIGLAGHGMGAGAAILAAAGRERLRAVAALYPAETSPSSVSAAAHVSAPGLIIGPSSPDFIEAGNPLRVAGNWGGAVTYREIEDGTQRGFAEFSPLRVAAGLGMPQSAKQEIARGLLTGFLLHRVANENKYSAFSDPTAVAKKVLSYDSTGIALKLADSNAGNGTSIKVSK